MQTKMLPIMDPEKMFPSVEKMLYSQAWKFANAYPITFEEAKSEAYFAFVKACYDYKPERGQKFSTWCYYWVWCKLKDLITARTVDPHVLVDTASSDPSEQRQAEEIFGEADDYERDFKEKIEELAEEVSVEARELLQILIDTPPELLEGKSPTPNQLMVRAKKFLVAEGRDKCKIETAHLELKNCFRLAWT